MIAARSWLVLAALLVVACGDAKSVHDVLPELPPERAPKEPWEIERERMDIDRAAARGKLTDLVAQIEAYARNAGRLPRSLADLTPGGHADDGGLLIPEGDVRIPIDPWGERYELAIHADGTFDVRSLGPDHEAGTDDDLVETGRTGPADR